MIQKIMKEQPSLSFTRLEVRESRHAGFFFYPRVAVLASRLSKIVVDTHHHAGFTSRHIEYY